MHWILQNGVLKKRNLEALIEALVRAELPYSVVAVPRGELRLVPEVDPAGPVMVSGAITMARIATERGWRPGSFLNDNFHVAVWTESLGKEMLNFGAEIASVAALSISGSAFVRPVADSKDFDGRVFTPASLHDWKRDNPDLLGIDVLAAPLQEIYREYRLFMVGDEVITGSQYMQAGRPHASVVIDPEALDYARSIARHWQPAQAFALHVALTPSGYRVVEFNNINSSGFYASDVDRYVAGMEAAFGA